MSNKEKKIDNEIEENVSLEDDNCSCDKDCKNDASECLCDGNVSDDKDECSCKKHEDKREKKGIFKKNNQEIEKLKEENANLREMLLRNQAELQNYKRRKDGEVEKLFKYKDEELIKEFLPIIDNFERAIKMDDDDLSDEVSKFLEGFKIIYTNTLSMLEKFEVKEVDAEGIEFDPEYHHAVLTEHDENKPEGVILEVLQKGYMYKDRVIRPAMVKVNE